MADHGVWFKLWVGADDEPDLGNLGLEDFARWCKFGMYLKKFGNDGQIELKPPCLPLQYKFKVVSFDEVISVIQRFPNCHVTGETNVTVTWKNWAKYQGDNSTLRVRKFRKVKRYKRRREEMRREEMRREEMRRENSPPSPSELTPEKLVELYNEKTPQECPSVEVLSPARREKARKYLASFPKQEFWQQVFDQIHRSKFLRGHKRSPGHDSFIADFDWLLTKGKDGTENAIKVHDGRYTD